MSITINSLDELTKYLGGVLDRGDHHARNVHLISLALAGAMFWRRDIGSDIKVREQAGDMKNVIWFFVSEQRYVLRYNHEEECIQLLEESLQGKILHSFTNATPLVEVERVFRAL